MAPNFRSLLSKPVESAKRPPVIPAGTYFATLTDYKLDESKNVNKNTGEKTPMLVVTLRNLQPGPDIDTEGLKDDDGAPIDLSKRAFYHNFILTDNAIFRLREFQESCKMPIQGRSFEETIPEMKGLQVILSVAQRPTEDGQSLRNELIDVKGNPA